MIQTRDRSLKEIRIFKETEPYKIAVYRSLLKGDRPFYTAIHLKERELQARFLSLFSQQEKTVSPADYAGMFTVDSTLIVLFRHHRESPLFYYLPLYCSHFSQRVQAANSLVSALIASKLPLELLYLLSDEANLNLSWDHRVYFNYFLELDRLPARLTQQAVIQKTAETVLRIVSEGLSTIPPEIQLFRRKVQSQAFHSFADILSDLRRMPAELPPTPSLPSRVLEAYRRNSPRIHTAIKSALFLFIILGSLFYSITEWRSRAIAASQTDPEIRNEYEGMKVIGTVQLAPEEPTALDPASGEKNREGNQ